MATELYLLAEEIEPVMTKQVGWNGMVHTGQCKMMQQVVMALILFIEASWQRLLNCRSIASSIYIAFDNTLSLSMVNTPGKPVVTVFEQNCVDIVRIPYASLTLLHNLEAIANMM